MPDYTMRRRMMVDTQVRPSDVTLFPIIEAMLKIPRERFVPDRLREAAYRGENLPIGRDRTILEPRTLAKMLNALDIRPTDLVLDIGPGFGYSTAVIAHLAQVVVGVECESPLAAEAQAALSAEGIDNAVVEEGALTEGAPGHGPYDAIAIQGAVARIPDAIADQLADGGRIVAIFVEDRLGTVRHGVKADGRINWRFAFNAGAPVLPGFEAASEFSL